MKNERKKEVSKFIWKRTAIILFWLIVWQIVAALIKNPILMEGPIGVGKRLFEDIKTPSFYQTVGASLLRIMGGMLTGVLLAVIFAILSWKKSFVEELLKPVVQFLKAAPITCFVVLLLIWVGSEKLTYYVALIVSFPPVYFNFLEGMKQFDGKLLEVAKVYHMPFLNRLYYVYMPEIKPYFFSALTLAVGMAFKAGVAAEIIGTPDYSMGERIYMSKIYLDTAGVMSWMLTVILVAFLCEKVLMQLMTFIFDRRPSCVEKKRIGKWELKPNDIGLKVCSFSYGEEMVVSGINLEFRAGEISAVTGLSGIGKTTLLKGLWGLVKPVEGEITGIQGVRAGVFQENRLFESFTAVENVFLTGNCIYDKTEVEAALKELFPNESLKKTVREYSGGMKRRVEIARALLSDSNILLLDEPFAGLDEDTKGKTIEFIKKYQNGRTIIFTTHSLCDIEKLKATEYRL